jgi:hypothetical protein
MELQSDYISYSKQHEHTDLRCVLAPPALEGVFLEVRNGDKSAPVAHMAAVLITGGLREVYMCVKGELKQAIQVESEFVTGIALEGGKVVMSQQQGRKRYMSRRQFVGIRLLGSCDYQACGRYVWCV